MKNEVALQRDFFSKRAAEYDSSHFRDENEFALSWLLSCVEYFSFESILEVGAGTGRALLEVKRRFPNMGCLGVEPVSAMRAEGHAKGLGLDVLIDGDGYALPCDAESFDLVAAFALLHHVEKPDVVVREMLRVARRAIFISDCNNFGHGSALARFVKLTLSRLGLWGAFNYLRTRGKGYYVSEGDGVAYSYSVFNNLHQIRKACPEIHLLTTRELNVTYGALVSDSHVALLGMKQQEPRTDESR